MHNRRQGGPFQQNLARVLGVVEAGELLALLTPVFHETTNFTVVPFFIITLM